MSLSKENTAMITSFAMFIAMLLRMLEEIKNSERKNYDVTEVPFGGVVQDVFKVVSEVIGYTVDKVETRINIQKPIGSKKSTWVEKLAKERGITKEALEKSVEEESERTTKFIDRVTNGSSSEEIKGMDTDISFVQMILNGLTSKGKKKGLSK